MATSKSSAPTLPPTIRSSQQQLSTSLQTLISNYASTTPARLKLIDSFLLFCLLSGILQFAYRILVTSFPYNAFLGGYVPSLSSRVGNS
jgi:oligosaccharyltransferase complex subunit epsilon